MRKFLWSMIILFLLSSNWGSSGVTAKSGELPTGSSNFINDGTYSYRRWMAIFNRTDAVLSSYPLEITSQSGTGFDHASLVAAGKAQADGDDLRVEIDGTQVDRWIVNPNSASTKVWVNLSLQPQQMALLTEGFSATDVLSILTVDDTGGFPSSGLIYDIASGEAFTYTSTDATHFLGVSRAARYSFLATGTIGDNLVWIEHEVYLLYGNDTIGAPVVDDNYQPAFAIASSNNTLWDYDDFGEDDGLRTASWTPEAVVPTPAFYIGYHMGTSNPWNTIGIEVNFSDKARWWVRNSCGITHVDVAGQSRMNGNAWVAVGLQNSLDGTTWNNFGSASTPLPNYTWVGWSTSRNVPAGSTYVALYMQAPPTYSLNDLDASDFTLTLNSSNTPGVMLTSERERFFVPLILKSIDF